MVGREDVDPPDIAAVAIVLRTHIINLIITERHPIDRDVITTLPVGIILPWASSIIFYRGEIGRQTHPHSELRYQRDVGRRRAIVGFDLYISGSVDAVSQVIVSTYRQ